MWIHEAVFFSFLWPELVAPKGIFLPCHQSSVTCQDFSLFLVLPKCAPSRQKAGRKKWKRYRSVAPAVLRVVFTPPPVPASGGLWAAGLHSQSSSGVPAGSHPGLEDPWGRAFQVLISNKINFIAFLINNVCFYLLHNKPADFLQWVQVSSIEFILISLHPQSPQPITDSHHRWKVCGSGAEERLRAASANVNNESVTLQNAVHNLPPAQRSPRLTELARPSGRLGVLWGDPKTTGWSRSLAGPLAQPASTEASASAGRGGSCGEQGADTGPPRPSSPADTDGRQRMKGHWPQIYWIHGDFAIY